MYYSLRITLGKVFNTDIVTPQMERRIQYLIADIVFEKVCADTNYVLAMEKKNKYGEETLYHYHYNFDRDWEKETLRKWITRLAEKKEYKLKGKSMYCFQQHNNVDDYHRWFRYCLKEKHNKKHTNYIPESGDPTLEELIMLAKDERARSVKSNCERREKMAQKQTYFDKIVEKMDALNPPLKMHMDIFIYIAKSYVTDGKPVNPVTIKGYTNNYMLMKNLISYEEFYKLHN